MTGTELEIIPPERSEIAGSDAERLPSLQTTARTDLEAARGLAQVARRRLCRYHQDQRRFSNISHRSRFSARQVAVLIFTPVSRWTRAIGRLSAFRHDGLEIYSLAGVQRRGGIVEITRELLGDRFDGASSIASSWPATKPGCRASVP